MRPTLAVLSVAVAALAGAAQAASSATSAPAAPAASAAPSGSAPTPQEIKVLQAAQAAYPKCALICMATLIPKSSCKPTDLPCLCTNTDLNAKIGACVVQGCTIMEGLATQNVSMTMCGAPVRDKSSVAPGLGLSFGILALLVWFGRLSSGILPTRARVPGWDDWTMCVSVALAVPPTVFSVLLGQNGLGKDMWTLTQQQIENVLMYYYMGEIFYISSQAVTKISLLIFLLRVFPDQSLRKWIFAVLGLCVAYAFGFVFATIFQCSPIPYSWHQIESDYHGSCNDIHMQGWLSATFNIVLDLMIIVLPLPCLARLQLGLKKKIMLLFMFSLGIFVTLISVIRLRSLIVFANTTNITWDYLEAAYWSTVELHCSIICACLPSLRTLFIALGARALKTNAASSAGSGGSGGSGAAANSAGSASNSKTDRTVVSTRGSEKRSPAPPRRGDEGDFVPLVEIVDLEKGGRSLSRESLASAEDSQRPAQAC